MEQNVSVQLLRCACTFRIMSHQNWRYPNFVCRQPLVCSKMAWDWKAWLFLSNLLCTVLSVGGHNKSCQSLYPDMWLWSVIILVHYSSPIKWPQFQHWLLLIDVQLIETIGTLLSACCDFICNGTHSGENMPHFFKQTGFFSQWTENTVKQRKHNIPFHSKRSNVCRRV